MITDSRNYIKKTQKTDRYVFLFLILGISLTTVSPWLFTKNAFWDWLGFDSSTGVIGDTIGGITSPIVNLIGAVLVYFSFLKQKEANDIQILQLDMQKEEKNQQNEFELIEIVYSEIKKEISQLKLLSRLKRTNTGDEIYDFAAELIRNHSVVSKDGGYIDFGRKLSLVLLQVRYMLELLLNTKLPQGTQEFLFLRYLLYFENYLRPGLELLASFQSSKSFDEDEKAQAILAIYSRVVKNFASLEERHKDLMTYW